MDEQEKRDNSEQEDAGEKQEAEAPEASVEETEEKPVDADAPAAEESTESDSDEDAADESADAEESQPAAEADTEEAPAAEGEEPAPVAEAEEDAPAEADSKPEETEEAAPAAAVAVEDEPAEEESEEVEEELQPAPEIAGLIGRKLGMTTYYTDDGRAVPVTAVEVGPCVVTQVKTEARHGYQAVQIGFLTAKNLNKPMAGHLERSGERLQHLQEFAVKDLGEFEVGQKVLANLFETGDSVKVSGTSKGKGFAGGVKRYGFAGGPKTHGQSDRHRAPGSVGAGSSPGRTWPGTRMAGHMGSAKITQRGLKVVLSDAKRNLVLISGAVPGHKNSIVRIEKQA